MPGSASRRAAVIGSPITHSLSPALHRAAYAALGLDGWTYDAVEFPAGGLGGFLADLDAAAWAGVSVTMPHKEAACEAAFACDEAVAAVGAANTLIPSATASGAIRWHAHNTDVAGLVGALRGGDRAVRRVAIFGAGATARSAVLAAKELGAQDVVVVARRKERAHAVASLAKRLGMAATATDDPATEHAPDVLVSTVPHAASDAWFARTLWVPEAARVLDAVYDPWPSPMVRRAAARGFDVVDGVSMLVYQAVDQVRLMTGYTVSPDVLAAVVPERGGQTVPTR